MVAVYGTLPHGEVPIVASAMRSKAARAVTVVAVLALCTVAVVVMSSSGTAQRTELYDYETKDVNSVEGIWSSPDEAWEGIDTVLPTAATAWEDPSSAAGWNPPPPGQLAAAARWLQQL